MTCDFMLAQPFTAFCLVDPISLKVWINPLPNGVTHWDNLPWLTSKCHLDKVSIVRFEPVSQGPNANILTTHQHALLNIMYIKSSNISFHLFITFFLLLFIFVYKMHFFYFYICCQNFNCFILLLVIFIYFNHHNVCNFIFWCIFLGWRGTGYIWLCCISVTTITTIKCTCQLGKWNREERRGEEMNVKKKLELNLIDMNLHIEKCTQWDSE